jgi:hypothetical protein
MIKALIRGCSERQQITQSEVGRSFLTCFRLGQAAALRHFSTGSYQILQPHSPRSLDYQTPSPSEHAHWATLNVNAQSK